MYKSCQHIFNFFKPLGLFALISCFALFLNVKPAPAADNASLPTPGSEEYSQQVESGAIKPCGESNAYGCSQGKTCYRITHKKKSWNLSWGFSTYTKTTVSWKCMTAAERDKLKEDNPKDTIEERQEGSFENGTLISVDKNIWGLGIFGSSEEYAYDTSGDYTYSDRASNVACEIQRLVYKYQSSCYSCLVIKTLLQEFMKVAEKTYSLCREAGVKILFLASILWIAFFVLKQVSTFTNVEPISMINTFLKQMFKILFVYVVIVSGADTFITYVVNPVLNVGADYGLGLIESVEETVSVDLSTRDGYGYEGDSLISNDVLDKLLMLNFGIDRIVSDNLVIGHALTCHATHAGAWYLMKIKIVNFWIWICGAAIWFMGFMMVISIGYYLADICFKIGIAIMIFPIAIALWPFAPTKDKVGACISTILKSAAIFAFLSMTAAYAAVLISSALRDTSVLKEKIIQGDTEWIGQTFDLTGSYFLILVFAYIYALLLIGKTIKDYVDKFFGGGLISDTPMHMGAVRMVHFAKQRTIGAAKYAKDVAVHQSGRAIKATGRGVSKFTRNAYNKLTGNKNDSASNSGASNQTQTKQTAGGKATQASGAAIKNSGRAMEASGKAMETGGKAIDKAGKGVDKAGSGITKAGGKLSSSGIGAIIGIPMMAVGLAVQAGGKAMQLAGRATQQAGKATQKAGSTIKENGKRIEQKGRNMRKPVDNSQSSGNNGGGNNSGGNNGGGNNGNGNNGGGNNGNGNNGNGNNSGGNNGNGNNGGGNNGNGNNGGGNNGGGNNGGGNNGGGNNGGGNNGGGNNGGGNNGGGNNGGGNT